MCIRDRGEYQREHLCVGEARAGADLHPARQSAGEGKRRNGNVLCANVMKRPFLLALVPFFFHMVHGQDVVEQDSLRAIWTDDARPDTTRFKAGNELIGTIFYTAPPDSSLRLAQELLAFARTRKLRKQEGQALNPVSYTHLTLPTSDLV